MSRRVAKKAKIVENDNRNDLPPAAVSLKNDSDSQESEDCYELDETHGRKKNGRRVGVTDVDAGGEANISGDLSKLLESFGSDISKSLQAKRRRLEQFTQESVRSTTKRVIETTKTHSDERKKMVDEFQRQLNVYIQQCENEMEKSKDAEDKLQKLIQQQQRHQQQMRIAQSQRLKALKTLGDHFFKGMNELESKHLEQYSSVQADLRKEMALLQKKILMDTQQQEMMNVRKNLQSMLLT